MHEQYQRQCQRRFHKNNNLIEVYEIVAGIFEISYLGKQVLKYASRLSVFVLLKCSFTNNVEFLLT